MAIASVDQHPTAVAMDRGSRKTSPTPGRPTIATPTTGIVHWGVATTEGSRTGVDREGTQGRQEGLGEAQPQVIQVFTPRLLQVRESIGDRLANHYDFWTTLTRDPLILGFIRGVKLQFHTWPSRLHSRPLYPICNSSYFEEMDKLIKNLEAIFSPIF